MDFFRKISFSISYVAAGITGVVLLLLMFLFVVDVSGRYFFNSPLSWAFEMTELLMALGISISFAFAETQDAHVRVRVFYDRMSKNKRFIMG